jgi:hypothetical protein
MKKSPKNVGASVRARLLQLAKERAEDFQLVLTRYANERLLYRLAASPHGAGFVLKGAALFTLWTGRTYRATRDLDLLGFGDGSEQRLRAVFEDVLCLDVPADGVVFDVGSMEVGPIREDQSYGGVRIVIVAKIVSATVRLQVDVGLGDAITPAPELVDFPPLLEFPAPRLRAYPRETVVAEKLEAMVQFGMTNSRMKDFFDVVVLAQRFEFDGALLMRAIRATFERRGTPWPSGRPVALTSAFATDETKKAQWSAFVRKSGTTLDLGDLPSVVEAAAEFLVGPLEAASALTPWHAHWRSGGPWVTRA